MEWVGSCPLLHCPGFLLQGQGTSAAYKRVWFPLCLPSTSVLCIHTMLPFTWNWPCLNVLSHINLNKSSTCLLFNLLPKEFCICHAFASFFIVSVMSFSYAVSHQLGYSITSMMIKHLSLIWTIHLFVLLLQSKKEIKKVQSMSYSFK